MPVTDFLCIHYINCAGDLRALAATHYGADNERQRVTRSTEGDGYFVVRTTPNERRPRHSIYGVNIVVRITVILRLPTLGRYHKKYSVTFQFCTPFVEYHRVP